MDAQALIAALETPTRPKADDDDLAAIILGALSEAEAPEVITLAYGQTRRSEGWATEAEYLAACRHSVPMGRRVDRRSHLRWTNEPGPIESYRLRQSRRWGTQWARRQRARAVAAASWYGVPNIILGT